jgi:FkbH-like protein
LLVSLALDWLPVRPDWAELLAGVQQLEPQPAFDAFRALANSRIDFVSANRLDKTIQKYMARHGQPTFLPSLKLALLGSSTVAHLAPHIRLGALRRGLLVEIHVGDYGLYRHELADPSSAVHAFQPHVVLLALDAEHLAGSQGADADAALVNLRQSWKDAQSLGAIVLQQTVMPRFPPLMGNNEDRLPQSPATIVRRINYLLREQAADANVSLLALDDWVAAEGGLAAWFDPGLWHLSKHEVQHTAAPLYGDQAGRVLAAIRGRSSKCLVLDLDNTLWGGVIGDDGMDGIVLGQGTAAGEAHLALQRYAKRLSERGVILAVCSKNDEANALAPFQNHPEMILKQPDIACFVANWQDKATNLRQIAETLNIGLDSLVFVDDNPVERALIRRELPMIAVPELPEDPAGYVRTLASAGYFEALTLTDEDRARAEQYRANAARTALRSSATDMAGFLGSLKMELTWAPFDQAGFKRIVQLINKTNQFNLTTRRYTDAEVAAVMQAEAEGRAVTLQLRLNDIYGENGIIAIVIGKVTPGCDLEIDTWLMSCRVLGREVEQATLNLLAQRALDLGCGLLLGTYLPTEKNGMVKDLYSRLGFAPVESSADGSSRWSLQLAGFQFPPVPMKIIQGASCQTNPFTAS